MLYPHNRILFRLKKRILTHATTWMNLEDCRLITLSEITQSLTGRYYMIPLTGDAQSCQTHGDRKQTGGSQGTGVGGVGS